MVSIFLTKPAVRIQNNLPWNLATFSETPHCFQDNHYAYPRAFQVVRETWWKHVFMEQLFHQGTPYHYKTQTATCLYAVVFWNWQRLIMLIKESKNKIDSFISTQVGSPWISVFVSNSKKGRSAHFRRDAVSNFRDNLRHSNNAFILFYGSICCYCVSWFPLRR